jgi:hypothetical protein
MKRHLIQLLIVLALVLGPWLSLAGAQSGVGEKPQWGYKGYQPWWNIFSKRYNTLTPEEERLQKFWHDYYDSLRRYYAEIDGVDWVAYYKNHGYQLNTGPGGCPQCQVAKPIRYAPVFGSPQLQWAVPGPPAPSPPTQDKPKAEPKAVPAGPKVLPGSETRSPDDFELFLERILDAPRDVQTGPAVSDNGCLGGSCPNPAGTRKAGNAEKPAP